jgi:hypothetical protein
MKTPTSAAGLLAAGLLALAGPDRAFAGEPARSMAALEERLAPGTEVDIVDRQGRMLRGNFVRADEEGVLVTTYGTAEGRRVPAGDVMTVMSPGDPLKNGALIGAVVGALSSVLVFSEDTSTASQPLCLTTACKVGTSVGVTAVYAGVGMLIDRAVKGRTVVYRAPAGRLSWSVSPHPVPRGVGLRVGLQF